MLNFSLFMVALAMACAQPNKDSDGWDDDDWGWHNTDTAAAATADSDSDADADTDADADADADGDADVDPDLCDELVTKINGELADSVGDPRVGDQWQIRMLCDGVPLVGANLLKFQPPAVATVSAVATDAVFVEEGEATMTMQTGSFVYSRNLVVRSEAP